MSKLNELLDQADRLKSKLSRYRDWDQKTVQEALNIEYTYDSNRIEGNTLTLRETDLVIHKGLTVGGKPLVDHLEQPEVFANSTWKKLIWTRQHILQKKQTRTESKF